MAYLCVQVFADEPPIVRRALSESRSMRDLVFHDGGRAWVFQEGIGNRLIFVCCLLLRRGAVDSYWSAYDELPKWGHDRNAKALAEKIQREHL